MGIENVEDLTNAEVAPGGATKDTSDDTPGEYSTSEPVGAHPVAEESPDPGPAGPHSVDEDPENHIGEEKPDPWADKPEESV